MQMTVRKSASETTCMSSDIEKMASSFMLGPIAAPMVCQILLLLAAAIPQANTLVNRALKELSQTLVHLQVCCHHFGGYGVIALAGFFESLHGHILTHFASEQGSVQRPQELHAPLLLQELDRQREHCFILCKHAILSKLAQ